MNVRFGYRVLFICLCLKAVSWASFVPLVHALAIRKGNVVRIIGAKGDWQLNVNGEVFRIKGAGVGRAVGRDGVDYLKMARDMGANTVRTWGESQGDRHYLDTAHHYGLKVDAGIWLDPVLENSAHSYQDKRYLNKVGRKILRYIRTYKNHPAVILWNIGNEAVFFTKDENERVAIVKFLESVIQEVHKLDPDHPVIYTSSATNDIAYLKKYVPSLDIVGINAYGGIDYIHEQVAAMFDIPYLFTEFGSMGEWDRGKDPNGVSIELNDDSKMSYYKQFAHAIRNLHGHCLGGFVFYLGDTTQVSLSWWNINHGSFKKYPYLVMEDFYKEREFRRAPFVVKDVALSRSTLSPGEFFDVAVDLKNMSGVTAAVEYSYLASTASEAVLMEYPNTSIPVQVQGTGPKVRIKAPSEPGTYRIYAVASSGDYASILNKSIKVIQTLSGSVGDDIGK